MTILQVEHIVRDKVDAYEDECDLWKSDHTLAMLYFDIQGLVNDGIKLFHDICRLDENWRTEVLSGQIAYDVDFEDKLRSLIHRFHRTTLSISRDLIPAIEPEFKVENADKFRKVCDEVGGMVTPDNEFFCHTKLAKLRDEAISDFDHGQTVEYDLA